jgi:hypothetical protein
MLASGRNRYGGKLAVLTTMHGKRAAIAPAIQPKLGLKVELNAAVDTDRLGTFTQEVSRQKNMLATAIEKARLGMAQSRSAIGIASEGSFGPHPAIPFLAINRELIVFVDDERGIVVHEIVSSEDTNFLNAVVAPGDEIYDFLRRARFPKHAVVVSPHQSMDHRPTFRGIYEPTILDGFIRRCAAASSDGKALLQTDMRANFNPTRMKVIAKCAEKLADRIMSPCPQCLEAGWGIVDVERGLPCEFCGAPTNSVKFEIWGCAKCTYSEKRFRLDGIAATEQMYCNSCNP